MIYNIAIIASILFMLFIIMLVRDNKLEEKYSILWFVFAILILILTIFPKIIDNVAKFFGVYYAPSLLFLIGFIVLAIYVIHISIVLTKQNKKIVKLVQEHAILEDKLEQLEKNYKENNKK